MKYLVLLLMLFTSGLSAQSVNVLAGDIDFPARLTLVSGWGDIDHEVGYCITKWHYDDTTYSASTFDSSSAKVITIDSIGPKIKGVNGAIIITCKQKGTPFIHTHNNRMCAPSRADSLTALHNNHIFDVIQCDADAFVFYHVNAVNQSRYSTTNAWIYGWLSAGVLFANEVWQFDTDKGGYPNVWYISKQGLHFTIASTLTFAASAAHVNPWVAASITCASGAVYEKTQGYVNSKDIIADCSGAFITAAFVKIFERKH
jgi:hypothetical protein